MNYFSCEMNFENFRDRSFSHENYFYLRFHFYWNKKKYYHLKKETISKKFA